MRWEQDRRPGLRRTELLDRLRVGRKSRVHRIDPEIDPAVFFLGAAGLIDQPFPCDGRGVAIDRVVGVCRHTVLTGHDHGESPFQFAQSIESSKSLAEGIQWRSFGDEGVHIQIGPTFNCLSRNDE